MEDATRRDRQAAVGEVTLPVDNPSLKRHRLVREIKLDPTAPELKTGLETGVRINCLTESFLVQFGRPCAHRK